VTPVEHYLNECLMLVFYFWDRANRTTRQLSSYPISSGDRWPKAFRQSEQYGRDSDFLLQVIGAR